MALTRRYDEALVWAHDLHRDQVRKESGIPYVSHLLSVSALVLEYSGDEDQAIAALLHDSIEDIGVTDAQIAERFGDRVASIVRGCTDSDTFPKPPWLERKRAYIAHLSEAPNETLLVSLADKTHNARSVAADVERTGEDYFEVFTGGADGTRWYYRRLADVFVSRLTSLCSAGDAPDGCDLLARYLEAINSFGATRSAAEAFEPPTSDAQPEESSTQLAALVGDSDDVRAYVIYADFGMYYRDQGDWLLVARDDDQLLNAWDGLDVEFTTTEFTEIFDLAEVRGTKLRRSDVPAGPPTDRSLSPAVDLLVRGVPRMVLRAGDARYVITDQALDALGKTKAWVEWVTTTTFPGFGSRTPHDIYEGFLGAEAGSAEELLLILGNNNMGGGVPVKVARTLTKLSRAN